MKFIDEFRDDALARKLAGSIAEAAVPDRQYHLMEFCGGHTHAVFRYGIPDLLPSNVHMVHGPGCPVCVLPIGRVDSAISLARDNDVILCTYADMMRVPGSNQSSLYMARAEGADVRMVYSSLDALSIAEDNPDRQVVFFAIGFETTTPPTAAALLLAKSRGLGNFTVFCNHVLTPAAVTAILESSGDGLLLDGFIGPAHVCAVIGSRPFEVFASDYGCPVVISGFEPLDVMQAIRMLIRQLNAGRSEVENEYTRVVTRDGNLKAQALVDEVLELRREFEWRGLGSIPRSALGIRESFAGFDAERRFDLPYRSVPDHKGCQCAAILRGVKKPTECGIFGKACTPENPVGSCMVSSEGACAAYYAFGRFREQREST